MYTLNKFNISKHFFNKFKLFICLTLLCIQLPIFQYTVYAQNLPCQTATVSGHYRHPKTGIIEDSGGDSSEALGQSMVSNVVTSQALVETTKNNTYLISLRFNLMNNLSDIKLSFQTTNNDSWTTVSYEQTAKGDDTGDLRFEVPTTDIIIKAECMVDAMGRYVIFYITLNNFTDGNAANFAQTLLTDNSTNEDVSSESNSVQNDNSNISESESIVFNPDESSGDSTSAIVSATDLLQATEGLTTNNSVKQDFAETSSIPEQTVAQTSSIPDKQTPQELNISTQVWFMLFIIILCANILSGLSLWGIKAIIQAAFCSNSNKKENLELSIDTDDSKQLSDDDICNIDDIDLMKGFIHDEI